MSEGTYSELELLSINNDIEKIKLLDIDDIEEKLKEKNERLIENDRLMGELKSEVASLKGESLRRKDE